MLNAVIVDFETRSKTDIRRGSDIYASDPSTDILCMAAIHTTTGREWVWVPPQPFPQSLTDVINEAEFVMAHNARFDQLIWEFVGVNDYQLPTIPKNKWYCTSAQCRVNALPAGLDDATLFTTGAKQKLTEGKKLIRLLSIPNAEGGFNEDPQALKRMADYCLQDVRATFNDVFKAARLMTVTEHRDWLVSEAINDRGVKIDLELARLCTEQADAESIALAAMLSEMTDGHVEAVTQIARLKKWALPLFSQDVIDTYFTKIDPETEETKITFDKGSRAKLLDDVKTDVVDIPRILVEVMTLVEEGNKSSVAKFRRMLELADPVDHRVRGAYMYAGASQTKRFSAKGLQVHNFPRESMKPNEVDRAKEYLRRKEAQGIDTDTSIMDTLSKMLRPAIIPDKGKTFIVCDWSAIEGRVLPWLANSAGGERVLDIFRNDEDIYMHTAKGMGINDRQIGKVATLALGYQGGVNAFNAMGKGYGLYLPQDQAQDIVTKWREANPWAVKFWAQLERASLAAFKYPMTWRDAGRVSYLFAPKLLGGTLLCRLPDDSVIQYPQARIESHPTPWGDMRPTVTYAKTSIKPKVGEKEWTRAALYSGLACENCTQAVAASILRDALYSCEKQGLNVVLHVHDEIVLEERSETVDFKKEQLQKIMETPPDWAAGLPLKAVPEVKSRYGK